jgi:hypothetical protein
MELPNIEFSSWRRWKERKHAESFDWPGVYILAKFESVPSGHAGWLDQNVIYIGETLTIRCKGDGANSIGPLFKPSPGTLVERLITRYLETKVLTYMLRRCLWLILIKV